MVKIREVSYFSLRQYELRQVLRVSSQLPGYCVAGNTPKVGIKIGKKSIFGIMNKRMLPVVICMMVTAACHQPEQPTDKTVNEDSSLIVTPDTITGVAVVDSGDVQVADTVHYEEGMLVGKWLQPVPGVEKQMQGFLLKKNGRITSINTYSLVYDKWTLMHDTLLFWSHGEVAQQKDSSRTIDTMLIKALTDSSLVLFPIKAAEGYQEEYRKAGK
jgi:hypothetical protein